jgi:uncharacterized protein YgiM (DUF1202 family)
MRKFAAILFSLMLMTISVGVVSAQGGVQTTVESSTRLRSGPGTDWRILGTLAPGTPVNLDARDGTNNFWVRGITPDGTVGWMASEGLAVGADQLNTLPIKLRDEPFSLAAPEGGAPPPPSDDAASGDAPAEDAAAPPPPVAANLAPIGGFGYGGHVQSFSEPTVNAMRTARMTWVKKQVRYLDGMDAGGAIGQINAAHGAGFRILLGVVGNAGQLNNPGYNERYAGFVAQLAAAGADAIEVWNEPNIDREWPSGQISPQAYTNFLANAYNAIKGANPATIVISGAPAPTGFFGGCSGAGCDDLPFIQGMNAAGASRYMDCVGVHYNEGIVPPDARSGDPRGNSGYYTRYFLPMIETYSGAFGGRVPLCFTEMGYLTPEGYGPLPGGFAWASDVTIAQQAAWLDRAVALARNSGRVRLMIIWNVDFSNYGADPMAGYAMIRADGGCPACVALGN